MINTRNGSAVAIGVSSFGAAANALRDGRQEAIANDDKLPFRIFLLDSAILDCPSTSAAVVHPFLPLVWMTVSSIFAVSASDCGGLSVGGDTISVFAVGMIPNALQH